MGAGRLGRARSRRSRPGRRLVAAPTSAAAPTPSASCVARSARFRRVGTAACPAVGLLDVPVVRGAFGAVVLVASLAVALPAPASAQDGSVDAAAAASLAREAVDDDAALAELRAIDEVDGRPVDLAAATEAMGADRAARLDGLAASFEAMADPDGSDGQVADADTARSSAEEVLDDDKFQETELPRPFRRPLELLADVLRPVGRLLDRVFSPILDLPGGPYLLAAVLGAAGAALVAWLIGRRSRAAVADATARASLVDPAADPDELEGRAAVAESDGDLGLAVRLRYEAGLLRLVRLDRLQLRPDTTAADAARQVGSPTMDRLTVDFEEIVYGGRGGAAADVARSRSGWVELLGVGAHR